MTIQILDASTDISTGIDWRSIDLTMVLTKEQGTLKFDILNNNSPTIPALGDVIYLKYNGTTLFGGTCTEREIVIDGGLVQRYKITCMDWGYRFNSKLVHKSYSNMDPHDIVVDLVTNFAGSGFTTNHVQVGNFKVASIKFNYEQPTKALEALAKQIGWDWYIDPNKDVHFFFATTQTGSAELLPAPFNIDDTSGNVNWSTLDIDQSISNMKNSIYVIGGIRYQTYGSGNTPDIYTSVGGQFVYYLAYPYDITTLNVKLGGLTQSIGTDGQTPAGSVNVLYNNGSGGGAQGGSPFIRFTSDPGSGSQILVYGNASLPIVAFLQDNNSVATYGAQPDVINDKQIRSVQEAQERAEAEIIMFGHPVYDVKFDTISALSYQLYIGQTILLNSVKIGISNYPLIVKRIEARGYSPTQLIMSVECLGSDNVTFTDIMLNLLQQANAQNVSPDNTILEIILYIEETIPISDTVTVTGASGPYKWGVNTPQPRWNFATWS